MNVASSTVTRFTFAGIVFIAAVACAIDLLAQSIWRVPMTLKDIQSRVAQLNPPDKDLPEGQQQLNEELRRLDDEVKELRGMGVSSSTDDLAQLAAFKTDLSTTLDETAKLDCTKVQPKQLRSLTASMAKVTDWVGRKTFVENFPAPSPNPWSDAPWMDRDSKQALDKGYCEELKGFVGDPRTRQGLLGYVDELIAVVNRQKHDSDETIKAIDSLRELLQKRRAAVLAKADAASTQHQLGKFLWLVMLIIGGLSVAAIAAVRLFEKEVQMEWVASGQVIQFVTVMILLSVIMALGLSDILKETTLGTLLGGIGGYVLAQGVGRAAARDAKRP